MSLWFARVLFAKQVNRKRKTWQDGFLSLNNQDQNIRSAKLYDESGTLVSSGRVPASEDVTPSSTGVTMYGMLTK